MTFIDRLNNIDLTTHWIKVDTNGYPSPVKKDSNVLRVCKGLLGCFICHDFYSHIRSNRVVEAIALHAHQAPNAKNVQVLLDLVVKLECRLNAFNYHTNNHYWNGSEIKKRILNVNADKITGTELDPKRRKRSQVQQAPAKPQDDLQRVIQAARNEYRQDVLRAKKGLPHI